MSSSKTVNLFQASHYHAQYQLEKDRNICSNPKLIEESNKGIEISMYQLQVIKIRQSTRQILSKAQLKTFHKLISCKEANQLTFLHYAKSSKYPNRHVLIFV